MTHRPHQVPTLSAQAGTFLITVRPKARETLPSGTRFIRARESQCGLPSRPRGHLLPRLPLPEAGKGDILVLGP